MISAPVARTSAGFIAFTVAAVPTGMKAGVRISPRRIAIVPARARPSVAETVKAKRVLKISSFRRTPESPCLPESELRFRLSPE